MIVEEAAQLFLGLTPDRVLEAVEAGGLSCRTLCYPLNSFENRVYEVELTNGCRVIAKFYRPGRWSEAAILEEHRFLAELVAEEIEVCPVRPFPDGSTLKQVEGIYYSLADRRGGRAPDELDDERVLRLGRMVARIHNVGARRPAPDRPRLDADHYVRRQLSWLLEHRSLPAHLEDRYVEAASSLAQIADRGLQGVATHRIHADLHLGNVLDRDGALRVLDFDDMCIGPAVQDLWLALPGRGEASERQRELFLEGYEQFRRFDRSTLELIEPLRALRLVRYAAWLARRWNDPAFQQAWPHFGTAEFWRDETEALEAQLQLTREQTERTASPRIASEPSPEQEALLDNKDYFWDWED